MAAVQWIDRPAVEYPESDGQPMAENTLQFQWIVTVKENLEIVFAQNQQVFVAGDLYWYPVEGNNKVVQAPDTLVVFGRPKGHRGSYRQWVEGGIAPQVVWEIWSPANRAGEVVRKFQFYEKFGVEEYYVYDPERRTAAGWRREGDLLVEIDKLNGWTSPRLGIRFELTAAGLKLYRPDGSPFLTMVELENQRRQAEERLLAEQKKADAAQQKAGAAQARAERLADQLRALGAEPEV